MKGQCPCSTLVRAASPGREPDREVHGVQYISGTQLRMISLCLILYFSLIFLLIVLKKKPIHIIIFREFLDFFSSRLYANAMTVASCVHTTQLSPWPFATTVASCVHMTQLSPWFTRCNCHRDRLRPGASMPPKDQDATSPQFPNFFKPQLRHSMKAN